MRPRLQKQSSSRRVSVETTLTSRDVSMLPSLPFSSKAELLTNHPRPPPPHRSRERGDANGRRRSNEQHGAAAAATSRHRQPRRSSHTGITADTAQGMISEIIITNRDKNKDKSSQHREPPRRVTVSFAPSDEQLQQLRQSQGTAYNQQHAQDMQQVQHVYHKGFRPDYVLGESSRHTSHMIVPQDDTQALELVNTLSKHDFAWVKRSDGTYTYALANRTTGQEGYDGTNGSTNEEVMVFVIDESGSTKNIRKKYWCEYIRLVSMQGADIEEKDVDPAPPIVETRACAS